MKPEYLSLSEREFEEKTDRLQRRLESCDLYGNECEGENGNEV